MRSMATRSIPLSNYPVMRSSDPELVRDRLFTVFGASGFDFDRSSNAFSVTANHLQMRGLGLSYCDYASDVSIRFGDASFVRQIFNIEGVGRYATGSQVGDIAPGSCTPILEAEAPLRFGYKAGYRQLVLRIEVAALRRNLGALIGQEIGQQLVFDKTSARQPAMEALRLRLFHFAHDFNARGKFFSDIAAAEVERMVIMKFLMCHRHNYTHLLLREPLPVSATAVKLVEEYIEANWDKPLDIETMVSISGISARSLFRQFSKTRGYSPADFVKRVRLDRARHMLEQGDSESSVIQIALKCGFQNAGHFARDYRVMFGELPSVTLLRAKR